MKTLFAALILVPGFAFAQTTTHETKPAETKPVETKPVEAAATVKISLDARGEDVREVLATLFAQTKKPYALDAAIKGKLYVKIDALPYEKALTIVLTQAGLFAKDRDGVVMVTTTPAASAIKPVVKPTEKPIEKTAEKAKPTETKPALTKPAETKPAETKPAETKLAEITNATYGRKVTTRLTKATLVDVFKAFGDQAEVTIEVDPSVPAYRVDAFFVKTSLKYALNRVCKAAGLKYTATDGKIVISPEKA